MRIIGYFSEETLARRFSSFLASKGIENAVDVKVDLGKESFSYAIWVRDEDNLEKATQEFQEFEKNPENRIFNAVKEPFEEEEKQLEEEIFREEKKKKPGFTIFLLLFCAFVFLIEFVQETKMKKEGGLWTQIEKEFLYDFPKTFEEMDHFFVENHLDPLKASQMSPDLQKELLQIEKNPFWQGVDQWILKKLFHFEDVEKTPSLFEKIRQGEVWRFFTPAFLHRNFLHILFNMLWLLVLGKQIEQRIFSFRFLILVSIVAVFSNTCQYLMGGASFLGFSGIVMGMAGFIWTRQKEAPWEGYSLSRSTTVFLVFFVLVMLGLQLISFGMQLFGKSGFAVAIANTAHISGAISGMICGKIPFFGGKKLES